MVAKALKALEVDPQFLIPYDIKKDPFMGRLCEDTISGFQGFVVGRTIWLFGCSRVCMQGVKLDKDNKPVLLTIDDWQCKVIKEGEPGYRAPLPLQPVKYGDLGPIALGSVVEDGVTGFKGIAYGSNYLMSGHVEINVQPRIKDPKDADKAPDSVWTLINTLKIVSKSKSKKIKQPTGVMTRQPKRMQAGARGSGGAGRKDPGRGSNRDRR